MRYYTVEIKVNEGVESRGLFLRDGLDDAVRALFNTMAYSMGDATCDEVTCVVMDEQGTIHKKERWVKPVAESEEE